MKRKKITKLKNGFTMIELLGAIVIIGILATIGIVSVTKVLNSSHDKFNQSQGKIFTQAGQNYFSDNKRNLPTVVGEKKMIFLSDLVSNNYIDKIYGYDKKPFNLNSSFVTVTKLSNGKYKYEYSLCYDEAGTDCVNKTTKPNQTSNNSEIQFAYAQHTTEESNILYTNNQVLTTITITKGSKNLTGYKYEIIKNSNNKQVKTSEIINVGTTGQVKKDILLTHQEYKDGQYKIRVTSYDTDGAAKSVTSGKIIYVDTVAPTCKLSAPGANSNGWYNGTPTIAFENRKDDGGSGIKTYGLGTATTPVYNLVASNKQENETNGTIWKGYVQDKAGNEGNCSIEVKIDKTPPTCALETTTAANSNGWWINDVAIRWNNKTDPASGVETYGLTTSTTPTFNKTDSNAQTIETKGTYWLGYVQDKAGNIGHCPIYIKLDKTNPTCALETTTAANSNGWWASPTTVRWNNKTDSISEINTYGIDTSASSSYNRAESGIQNTDTSGTSWYGHVKDNAGREGSCKVVIPMDQTPPTCTSSGGSGNWTNGSRTLTGTCSDGTSGCLGNASKSYNSEGSWTNQSPGTVTDKAGHTVPCPANQTVKIDKTSPSCTTKITSGTKNNGWYNTDVKVSLTTSDNGGSGVSQKGIDKGNSCPSTSYNSDTSVTITGEGDKCVKGVVKDNAGNTESCKVEFKVDKTAPTIGNINHTTDKAHEIGSGDFKGEKPCTNASNSSHYYFFRIEDELSGLNYGAFNWSTDGGEANAGNSTDRSGHKHLECIGTSKATESELGLSYKICDKAGNCKTG